MNTPVRLQRKRTKGFRIESPNGLPVVYVDRSSSWGNPFKVGEDATWADPRPVEYRKHVVYAVPKDAAEVVANYRAFVTFYLDINDGRFRYKDIRDLRGVNHVCWCPLCPAHAETGKPWNVVCADCTPCHSDVTLELANTWEDPR